MTLAHTHKLRFVASPPTDKSGAPRATTADPCFALCVETSEGLATWAGRGKKSKPQPMVVCVAPDGTQVNVLPRQKIYVAGGENVEAIEAHVVIDAVTYKPTTVIAASAPEIAGTTPTLDPAMIAMLKPHGVAGLTAYITAAMGCDAKVAKAMAKGFVG